MKQSEKPIDRVDQFFKNKLEDHTIAPSENAWAKVEAGLSKKNNVIVWRWAAAVLLMGALISIIYWSQRGAENVDPVLVEKKIEKEKSNASSEVKRTANTMSVAKTKVVREDTNHGEVKGVQTLVDKKSRSLEEESSKSKLKLMETEAALAQQYTIKDPLKDLIEEKIKTKATAEAEVASSKQKPIKLEFTLEALSSEETVATTNEVKSSGIKKVLQLAREMKQGEGPVSGLREKKDELFAHNFITGKERKQ